jgi:hypothetical protein
VGIREAVTKKAGKKPMNCRVTSIQSFFEDVLELRFFSKGVVKASYEPGKGKLVLVTGENATGKSFLRRVVGAALSEHEIESIALSMQFRTSGGIERCFVYGDEREFATGNNSASSIIGAISTSRGRDHKHSIVWDEPDVGLSDNYAAGAADEIMEFVNEPPKHLFFAIVTTHRRAMLERLVVGKPHHVRLGDDMTLEQVLAAPIKPTRLSDLRDRNIALFRRISKEFGL